MHTVKLVVRWESWKWVRSQTALEHADDIIFSAGYALAPITFGLHVRARADMTTLIEEMGRTQDRGSRLLVEAALGRERTRNAPEMNDVVSHQASLIAVQAGALQVSAIETARKIESEPIHMLCRQTLDELRQMVGILRISGAGRTELSPQSRLADIPALIDASGLSVTPSIRLGDLPSAVERTIYRNPVD